MTSKEKAEKNLSEMVHRMWIETFSAGECARRLGGRTPVLVQIEEARKALAAAYAYLTGHDVPAVLE